MQSLRSPQQQIRFARGHDDVRLAYALAGSGPLLIKAATWLSHLEFDWESPVWRHMLRGLSANATFARYDERGCGLSDWDVSDLGSTVGCATSKPWWRHWAPSASACWAFRRARRSPSPMPRGTPSA